jgi:hypothetical protein
MGKARETRWEGPYKRTAHFIGTDNPVNLDANAIGGLYLQIFSIGGLAG